MLKVMKLVKSLSRAEQLRLFEFLRDEEGLKAFRSLHAETERVKRSSRNRRIMREHNRKFEHIPRESRKERERRLSRPTGPLKSYSMAEFIEEAKKLQAAE